MNVHKMFRSLRHPRATLTIPALLGLALLAGCDTQAESPQQAPPPPQVTAVGLPR